MCATWVVEIKIIEWFRQSSKSSM